MSQLTKGWPDAGIEEGCFSRTRASKKHEKLVCEDISDDRTDLHFTPKEDVDVSLRVKVEELVWIA
jgi:hypothetical protein